MIKEKITNVSIKIDAVPLDTGMYIDSVPTTRTAILSMDLFNVSTEPIYSISVSINDNVVLASNITVSEDKLAFKNGHLGKTRLAFPIPLVISAYGDMKITVKLHNNVTDLLLDKFDIFTCFEVETNE